LNAYIATERNRNTHHVVKGYAGIAARSVWRCGRGASASISSLRDKRYGIGTIQAGEPSIRGKVRKV